MAQTPILWSVEFEVKLGKTPALHSFRFVVSPGPITWPCAATDSLSHMHIGYIIKPTAAAEWFPRYIEWNGSSFVNAKTDFLSAAYAEANDSTNPGIAVNEDNAVCFVYTRAGAAASSYRTQSNVLVSGEWSGDKVLIDSESDEGESSNRRQSVSVVVLDGTFHAFTRRIAAGSDVWHFSCDSNSSWEWTRHSVAVFGFGLAGSSSLSTVQSYQAMSDGANIHIAGIRNSDGKVVYRKYSGTWDDIEIIDPNADNTRVTIGRSGSTIVVAYFNSGGDLLIKARSELETLTSLTQITKTISATGTPESLTADETFFRSATLIGKKAARTDNVGIVYLGIGGTNNTQPYAINPGETITLTAPLGEKYDFSDWYLDVLNAGDGVIIIYSYGDWFLHNTISGIDSGHTAESIRG